MFDVSFLEKYPPDSVNIDGAFFNYIEDYHLRDQYSTDNAVNGSCAAGFVLEPDGVTCISSKFNNIASRPIVSCALCLLVCCVAVYTDRARQDMILWDFLGDVLFGRDWPSQAGVIFTVLVFADRETSSAGKLIEGEAKEKYFEPENENMGVFLPGTLM